MEEGGRGVVRVVAPWAEEGEHGGGVGGALLACGDGRVSREASCAGVFVLLGW